MAERSFPSIGHSPGDFYVTTDRPGVYIEQVATPTTGTMNAQRINSYPTMASGVSARGLLVLTELLAGTGGVNGLGITAIAEQDSTKRITGYLTAGTFSLINAADATGGMACIELTYKNTSSTPSAPGTHNHAYISVRDYSTGTNCCSLFSFMDVITEMSANSNSAIVSTLTEGDSTHGVRFMVGTVAYWFMVTSHTPTTAT